MNCIGTKCKGYWFHGVHKEIADRYTEGIACCGRRRISWCDCNLRYLIEYILCIAYTYCRQVYYRRMCRIEKISKCIYEFTLYNHIILIKYTPLFEVKWRQITAGTSDMFVYNHCYISGP